MCTENDEEDCGVQIPAASIGEVDFETLSKMHPKEAAEILRIEALMDQGLESHGDFLKLCELLNAFGDSSQAEFLLRRNINTDYGSEDIDKYFELFGMSKWDELSKSVEHFEQQLQLELIEIEADEDFMVLTYRTEGSPDGAKQCGLLAGPCYVDIQYTNKDFVVADIMQSGADEDDLGNEEMRQAMVFSEEVWISAPFSILE